jgi:microcystin-dependent protein
MEPFIGQIMAFGGNFAPRGWALCNGQLMSIAQNSALFSILGTTYGGDGVTTFGLPDLRGRLPMGWGNGPGLTPRQIGETAGAESVTLTINNMPAHNHTLACNNNAANVENPEGNVPANTQAGTWSKDGPNATMNAQAIGAAGGNQPVGIEPPFQCITWMIALEGVYPSRP